MMIQNETHTKAFMELGESERVKDEVIANLEVTVSNCMDTGIGSTDHVRVRKFEQTYQPRDKMIH